MVNEKQIKQSLEGVLVPATRRSIVGMNMVREWRGPLIGNTIKQFGEEVLWGKLDYLIVDLPPGTADAPLTLMQSFPISGEIVVFTPQGLVEMIVKKAVKMAQKMQKRVLGVVENMSYLYVPEIDRKIEIFGKSRAEQMAAAARAPLLGQIP
jgi:Mrp family chromosome partitioning ATPase